MDKNSKFTKKLLTEIGVALAVIIPLIVGIFYLRSTVENKVIAINDYREEIATKISQINSLVNLRSQYNDFASDALTLMRNKIPTKDQLINISQDFEALAQTERVGFGFSFLGETEPSESSLGFISFRLNINGDTFTQILSLIDKIENFKYLTRIDKVSIQTSEGGLDASMEGRVFFR
ncbi:MAG: hypothetical protein WD471_01415 [Candidatus Paceibacterota bacterium]